jgi:hypothetical protein
MEGTHPFSDAYQTFCKARVNIAHSTGASAPYLSAPLLLESSVSGLAMSLLKMALINRCIVVWIS